MYTFYKNKTIKSLIAYKCSSLVRNVTQLKTPDFTEEPKNHTTVAHKVFDNCLNLQFVVGTIISLFQPEKIELNIAFTLLN